MTCTYCGATIRSFAEASLVVINRAKVLRCRDFAACSARRAESERLMRAARE